MSRSAKSFMDEFQIRGNKMPVVVDYKMQKAAALLVGQYAYATCDLTIVSVPLTIVTAFTDADTVLDIGDNANTDAYLDSWVIKDVAAGQYDLASSVAVTGAAGGWITKSVPKGGCFYASIPNVSGTTGLGYGCIVAMPD